MALPQDGWEATRTGEYKLLTEAFPSILKLPSIGGYHDNVLNTERILSLKPDVILVNIPQYRDNARRLAVLERAGVKIWRVLPIRFGNFRMSDRIDLRYHRKLVIIDESVAYTGSLNMIAPKSAASGAAPQERWIDAMIRIEGPGTVVLSALWEGDCGLLSNCDENRDVNAYMELFTNGRHEQPGDVPLVCVHSGPYGNEDASVHLILRVISSARRSLTIVTPYFVPTETIVSALLNAASTNVRVRIIVPRLCDSRIVTWGGRRFFEELLDAGIEIYFYEDGMLHTKAITVDDEVSVFGTVNIDTRSLHLNFEHSMLIVNRAFTAELNGLFAGYFAGSFRLDPALWKKTRAPRPPARGVQLSCLAPLLTGLIRRSSPETARPSAVR